MPIPVNLANRILRTVFQDVFLSLHSGEPGATGANEVQGGGYRRQAFSPSRPRDGAISNTETVAFVMLPATPVSHLGVWDSEEGGRLLWVAALNEPVSVPPNATYFLDPEKASFEIETVG